MEQKIVIYTSSICPVCSLVRDFFSMQQVPFDEVNIDLRPLEAMKLIARTKQLRVPQTYIDGEWVGGFDPEKFFRAMNK